LERLQFKESQGQKLGRPLPQAICWVGMVRAPVVPDTREIITRRTV
jgi:hypothetical protein